MGHIHDTHSTKRFGIGLDTWPRRANWALIYLGAIVGANLLINRFGPALAIPVGFALIGLDLTSRDRLHDKWTGRGLPWRMALLIGSGSLLTLLINRDAGPIASASFWAFASSAIVDSIVYSILRERSYLVKVNGSNVFGAAVDSILFPRLAFGALLPWVVIGTFTAKVFGGFFWSLVIKRLSREKSSET